MHRAPTHDPVAPASPVAPLPWEWFGWSDAGTRMGSATAELRRITLDGQEIRYRFIRDSAGAPSRPAIVLLHGMGITIASFHGVAPWLFATHDLVLPDYSSFASTHYAGPPSLKAFAQTVWRIADALEIERVALAGNSLGGGLCLTAALHAPHRVSAMLLANPACFPQELPRMYGLVRFPLLGECFMAMAPAERFIGGVEYVGYVDKNKFDPWLKAMYIDNMRPLRNRLRLMEIMRQLPANARDLSGAIHLGKLGELHMPVLISWGDQDPLLAPGAGARLADVLPNATFENYPEFAHMPHEEAPDRIGPRWAEFLRAHP